MTRIGNGSSLPLLNPVWVCRNAVRLFSSGPLRVMIRTSRRTSHDGQKSENDQRITRIRFLEDFRKASGTGRQARCQYSQGARGGRRLKSRPTLELIALWQLGLSKEECAGGYRTAKKTAGLARARIHCPLECARPVPISRLFDR